VKYWEGKQAVAHFRIGKGAMTRGYIRGSEGGGPMDPQATPMNLKRLAIGRLMETTNICQFSSANMCPFF